MSVEASSVRFIKVLKEKNDKIEEKLNSLTGTLDKICELGAYYKNFAK